MEVLEKIKAGFAASNIKYELFEHDYVRTSEDAAKIRNLGIESGAKAIIFMVDKLPLLVVIRGNLRISTKKIKSVIGAKDVRLATPEEVTQFTNLTIGCIPPMGSVLGLPCYFDQSIVEDELSVVAFNPGSHYHSITMRALDLYNFERPVLGDFKNES